MKQRRERSKDKDRKTERERERKKERKEERKKKKEDQVHIRKSAQQRPNNRFDTGKVKKGKNIVEIPNLQH